MADKFDADGHRVCERCGERMTAFITSYFNTDTICIPCSKDEKDAPGFNAAREAETNAVQGGDLNYPGVGLSIEDREFLKVRLRARGGTWRRESPEPWEGSGTTAPS
jgi:hypothetical protein